MAGHDAPPDPAKALEYKEKGNKCFQNGEWEAAKTFYTKAITCDPSNPLLYTNRSMALLKLHLYPAVITDSNTAISLLPHNMKAYYHLAQAQIALHDPSSALTNAKQAHFYCVEEIHSGGKGGSSLQAISELVMRCKKEDWEGREEKRLSSVGGLGEEIVEGIRERMGREVGRLRDKGGAEEDVRKLEEGFREKIRGVRRVFEEAGESSGERKRREVPDWCIDGITFLVMLDPVVTKTGQSYDRSSIMEHLKRSQTDPLTREPLRPEDLRPNLALRNACEEFLKENGWAVDY